LVKVSQLRRELEDAEAGGRDLVVHTPAGYLLRATTDADEFRSLLAEAEGTARIRGRLAVGRTGGLAGRPSADFADEPFAAATVSRLAEHGLSPMQVLVAAAENLGSRMISAGWRSARSPT
jgi:hypothetical protein